MQPEKSPMRPTVPVISFVVLAVTSLVLMYIVLDNDRAVRARYALTSVHGTGDPIWLAGTSQPQGFVTEGGPVPELFGRVVQQLGESQEKSQFQTLLRIAEHMASGPGPGRGELDLDAVTTYNVILNERRGDCTDYARLFAALSYSAGLQSRIWTTSFEGFSSTGHVFSEALTNEYGWVFVDPINSFIVVDSAGGRPLSVNEFRLRLADDDPSDSIEIRPISRERFGFDSPKHAIEYYKRGKDRFAIRMANNVLSYDGYPWVEFLRPKSKSLEQVVSLMLGALPKRYILETQGNVDELRNLSVFRVLLWCLLGMWAVSAAVFAVALIRRYVA